LSAATVRIATRADADALMAVCRELHGENGLFAMDDEMVRGMLARAFDRRGGIIGVIEKDGRIEGSIYILISNFWYSRDNHLEELWSWVRPDCRKSDHAVTLIEFAQTCAKELDLPLVIGVITNRRMAGKVRLYRRKLGYPAGAFFVFNAKWQTPNEAAGEDFWERAFDRGKAKANGHDGARAK
jgi:hypothetical protein